MTDAMPPLALLAGGLATRLRPLTETLPKSLVEVAGEPFIAHQLRLLARQRIHRVVICTGFLGAAIRDFVGDGARFGLSVEYSPDGAVSLGTGGALRQALPCLGEEFLVMYGDSYLTAPFAPAVARFRTEGRLGLMTVYRNEGRGDRSNVVFRDGRILVYDKQTQRTDMLYIDYGLGMLRAGALADWPSGGAFDLAEVYRTLLAGDQLAAQEVFERFHEIGSPEGLAEADRFLLNDEGPSP